MLCLSLVPCVSLLSPLPWASCLFSVFLSVCILSVWLFYFRIILILLVFCSQTTILMQAQAGTPTHFTSILSTINTSFLVYPPLCLHLGITANLKSKYLDDQLTTFVHQEQQAPVVLCHHSSDTHTLTLGYRLVLGSGEFPPGSHSPPQAHRPPHSEGQDQTGNGMCGYRLARCKRTLGSLDISPLQHDTQYTSAKMRHCHRYKCAFLVVSGSWLHLWSVLEAFKFTDINSWFLKCFKSSFYSKFNLLDAGSIEALRTTCTYEQLELFAIGSFQ